MSVVSVILAILLFAVSLVLLFVRETLAPVAALLGLVCFWISATLPLNLNIVITWLCLTVIVTGVSLMQPPAVMAQRRGMGYITVGALTGMAVGLLGFSVVPRIGAIYAIMVLSVAVGIFLGYYLFTRTPEGKAVGMNTGRFFSYLLAKGFPAAIAVMQLGIALLLWMLPLLITD